MNQATGTLSARAVLSNERRLMLPGFFVRVRVPLEETPALLVPAVALGSDQAGRYVLVVRAWVPRPQAMQVRFDLNRAVKEEFQHRAPKREEARAAD